MRRSYLAPRIVAIAFASGAIVLAGCPSSSEPPAVNAGPSTETTEFESIEVDVAEEDPAADPNEPSSMTNSPPDATGSQPTDGTDDSDEATAPAVTPAVTIERPKDFQRPTLPDAALRNEDPAPAEPPVEITDRSAEAEDPNSLPGGTPIDDLFEGLDDKPSDAPNE